MAKIKKYYIYSLVDYAVLEEFIGTWGNCEARLRALRNKGVKCMATGNRAKLKCVRPEQAPIGKTEVVAYIDGSLRTEHKGNVNADGIAIPTPVRAGIGVVIVKDDTVVSELVRYTEKNLEEWQIVGELRAVHFAIEEADRLGIDKISIAHDLQCTYDFVSDLFEDSDEPRNIPSTTVGKGYREYVKENRDKISRFIKIAAHTGDTWNERADYLSKLGAGVIESKEVA